MSSKGKRRAAMRADKKRRKSERYKLGGKGQSTYAKKLRGERTAASIEAESRSRQDAIVYRETQFEIAKLRAEIVELRAERSR